MVDGLWRKIKVERVVPLMANAGRRTYPKRSLLGFEKALPYTDLVNFRWFCLSCPDLEICYIVCSKLSWSHHRRIMRKDGAAAGAYH